MPTHEIRLCDVFMAVLMVYANLIEYGKQTVFCLVFGHKDVIVLRVGIGLLCALLCLPVLCYLWEIWGFSKQKRGNKHMLWTTLLGSVRGTKEQNSP